jgi:alanyl-tRNA synthetase
VAFKLYDTFGFPMDLTRVIGAGRGLDVDEAGFERAMDEQRKRGRLRRLGRGRGRAVFQTILSRVGATKFVGYESTQAKSEDRRPGGGWQGSRQRRRRGKAWR